MKLNLTFILLLLLFGCKNQEDINLCIENLPSKTIDAQRQLVSVHTGNKSLSTDYTINSRTTPKERLMTRRYLSDVLNQLNLKALEHDYREPNSNVFIDLLVNPFKGTNLYTIIPSTIESDEYVLLGAHYDTARNCPGANDNATAMALLYGVAKKLSNVPVRQKNVMIVFFDQEEEDLVGSRAFAKYLKKKDYKIHSVHTFDQIGWDKDLDKAVEIELATKKLEEIYREKASELQIPIHTTKVNSTDHQSFRELGFNALGITEEFANGDTTPFKDTPKDTFDTVDFEYLESTTNLVFEVINHIITQN
ncbi:M28 family metallopeptidase [Winogradskyella sp. MIT101101]|uniref:M28 family metallopeptidase n=1 Tax=Winogradskyella sp. MIT101101 TaxID=3098297 RepID=UPI00399B4C21